jgi:hypothetical protein
MELPSPVTPKAQGEPQPVIQLQESAWQYDPETGEHAQTVVTNYVPLNQVDITDPEKRTLKKLVESKLNNNLYSIIARIQQEEPEGYERSYYFDAYNLLNYVFNSPTISIPPESLPEPYDRITASPSDERFADKNWLAAQFKPTQNFDVLDPIFDLSRLSDKEKTDLTTAIAASNEEVPEDLTFPIKINRLNVSFTKFPKNPADETRVIQGPIKFYYVESLAKPGIYIGSDMLLHSQRLDPENRARPALINLFKINRPFDFEKAPPEQQYAYLQDLMAFIESTIQEGQFDDPVLVKQFGKNLLVAINSFQNRNNPLYQSKIDTMERKILMYLGEIATGEDDKNTALTYFEQVATKYNSQYAQYLTVKLNRELGNLEKARKLIAPLTKQKTQPMLRWKIALETALLASQKTQAVFQLLEKIITQNEDPLVASRAKEVLEEYQKRKIEEQQ